MKKTFETFDDFWPFYMSQHKHPQCRILHFWGSTIALTLVLVSILSGEYGWFVLAPIAGYGGAWWGHFGFEKNKPATFTNPFYSFMGDWKMYWLMLTGKLD